MTDSNACAQCGKVPTTGKKAFPRCSRCLVPHYCSSACQRNHWKHGGHKGQCAELAKSQPHPHLQKHGPTTKLPNMQATRKFRCRFAAIGRINPQDIRCACFCCGMLCLKREDSEYRMYRVPNPYHQDWGPTPTGTVFADVCPFPASCLVDPRVWDAQLYGFNSFQPWQGFEQFLHLERLFFLDHDPAQPDVPMPLGCCCYCKLALHGKDPIEARRYCDDVSKLLQNMPPGYGKQLLDGSAPDIAGLSMLEKEVLSLVTLDPDVDLSRGITAMAGRFAPSKEQKKGRKVNFAFRELEAKAFALVFFDSAATWTEECGVTLMHYTSLRLYSLSNHWRQDMRYVEFTLHRLVLSGKLPVEVLDNFPVITYAQSLERRPLGISADFHLLTDFMPKDIRVRVHGLRSRSDLNGKIGTRGQYFPQQGRYEVTLDDGGTKIKIRVGNIQEV